MNRKNNFIIKEGANPNYLATICKIGELHPIEGADRLVRTVINGYDIVVSKDHKEGDIVVYFPVESAICEGYLGANNLFERSEFERNANAKEIIKLLEEAENSDEQKAAEIADKVKLMCGFFAKNGRVRMLKLRGQYSMGFVASVDSLVNYKPALRNTDWEALVGTQFSHIGDDEICHKYVPPIKENNHVGTGKGIWAKRMKRLRRFDRLVPGQFEFHYDTKMLAEHISQIKPEDKVSITVKVHGTSAIFANILTKAPRYVNPVEREINKSIRKRTAKIKKYKAAHPVGMRHLDREVEMLKKHKVNTIRYTYGNVYSSRGTIKNQYINATAGSFYDVDVWGCVNKVIAPYIEKGMTVYGEIVGYQEGSDKFIQKNHDYGCAVGTWKFMPYRITMTNEEGDKTEWDVDKVDKWTRNLVKAHPELADKIMFLNILFIGKMKDLYPDINTEEHWHENVLERLKNDKNFYMEEKEPMCKNNVPREGMVIRIFGDKLARAWKLKSKAHYALEGKQHDAGEADIEETA
jgi:hypothetical protein